MSYWFYDKSGRKCELCHQFSATSESRLCEDCEEAIVRLLRLTEDRVAHRSPAVVRVQAA